MKQVDIGMTTKERIIAYLREEDGYRSVAQIADAVGVSVPTARQTCAHIYWDHKSPLQRTVNRDTENGQQQIAYRAEA